ncbi:MAG: hypothetical protein KJ958_05610 [Gammaproteobacteria bacterium]|nr:hypothetical protein [Gammaproteobacteria bacterium]MBU1978631.1 hypothetical protein [Gammaproteobacteria bacterium]
MKSFEGYRFFQVDEGSEVCRIIRCWQGQMADFNEHIKAIKERHGISEVWETNSAFDGKRISGVSFSGGEIPQGWRHLVKHPDGMLTPVKGKHGDGARRLIKEMAPPSRKSVHKALEYKDGFTISGDMSVRSAGFNVYAQKIVATIPKDCKDYEPPMGLKELKMSELYALIEEDEVPV